MPSDNTVVEPTATNYQINVLTCALKGADFCDGNHIQYTKGNDGTHDFLRIDNVDGESCKPKPKSCHCKTMLAQVLEQNTEAKWIEGHFAAEDFMKGCKCYLGTAADAEFRFVKIGKATRRIPFTKNNYDKTCKVLKKIAQRAQVFDVKIFKT